MSETTIPTDLARRLLADFDELLVCLDPESAEEPVRLERQGDWTPMMVSRFRDGIEDLPAARALLELTASRPGEEVSYPEALEAAHVADREMRIQLAKMSKRSRRLFDRVTWPMRAWQAADSVMRYEMPTQIAHWWRDRDAYRHLGKYRALWAWLRAQEHDEVSTTFSEIEDILGFPLPPSSRRHTPHWYSYEGSAVVRAIHDAGWYARNVSLERETVTLERMH